MASAGILMAVVTTISACGGGADTETPPVAKSGNSDANASHENIDHYSGSNPLASNSELTGGGLVNQLANVCREVLNSQGQSGHMDCAAGTYIGRDVLTGKSCTTILTANGNVSFMNGGKSWKQFKLEEDFFYHKSGSGRVWIMEIFARNKEPIFLKNRRASFHLNVDTRLGKYIDIIQKNTDPNIGDDLNATCRTQF